VILVPTYRKAVKQSREEFSILDPSMEEAVDELIMGADGVQTAGRSDDDENNSGTASDQDDSLVGNDEEHESLDSEDELGARTNDIRFADPPAFI
jgi:hypothetical protein